MRYFYLYIIFIIILFFMPINLCKAQNSITLQFRDGSEQVTLLSSLNKITVSDGNLLLNKKEIGTNSYQISTIVKLTFGVLSNISTLSTDQTSIFIYPNPAANFIQLKNISSGQNQVIIYSINGNMLKSILISDETEQVDISNLDKGFYLLNVNGKTMKFVKQ